MKDIAASIVIITKNQRTFLERSLPILQAQTGLGGAIEIIVVDSGSTDGAQAWALAAGARVVSIAPETFNYARAHNAGAVMAVAPFVVRLSGDAIPCSVRWLYELIAPLRADETVAAAWGRQRLPDHVSNPVERLWESWARPAARETWQRHKRPVSVLGSTMAYRRTLWQEYPFDERLPQAEDYDWLHHWQQGGKIGVYVPSAAILHGHDENIARALRRSLAQSLIQWIVRTGLTRAVFSSRR